MKKIPIVDFTSNYIFYEKTKKGYYYFYRFSEKQFSEYNKKAFFKLMSHGSSGVIISFYTTGNKIKIKFQHRHIFKGVASVIREEGFKTLFEFSKENKEGIKNKSKRKERFFDGFDIRVNDKLVKRKQGFINSKFVVKFKNKNKEKMLVEIYLPLYIETGIKYVKTNRKFYKNDIEYKNVLALGDSITQGCYSAGPSKNYITFFERKKQVRILNQGVAGYYFNHHSLKDISEFIKPDYIFVAYGTNDWNLCSSEEKFIINATKYFDKLTSKFIGIPIYVITPIWRADKNEDTKVGKFSLIHKDLKKICKNYPNVKLINGKDLVPHDYDLFFDGYLHPNSLGFKEYASNLINEFDKLDNE